MAFAFLRTITIDHTKVPSDQTDFPLLFSGTFASLKTVSNGGEVTNANGYDIGFYSDAGLTTKLKWETERYIATTGEVVYWIKVPSVSSSVSTIIYLAYANPSITTDQSDPTNVWDSSFLGVYHLPDGTTLGALDSTGNARNGTLVNTPTAAAGEIDGGGSFASASSQYVDLGTGIAPTAITLSAWVNATSFPHTFNGIVERNNGVNSFSVIRVRTTGKLVMIVRAAGDVSYDGTGSAMSTGTWYYVVLTYNSSAGLVGYLNGSVDGTAAANAGLNTAAGVSTFIATDPADISGQAWNGLLDEVRISSIARSAHWVTAEYNNQSSPSTFYAVGTQSASSIAASISSAATVTAQLSGISAMVANITSTASIVASMAATAPIDTAISSTATVTANLTGLADLAAAITSSVSVSGILGVAQTLAVITSTATITATLNGAGRRSANISSFASVTAFLSPKVGLSAAITSTANVTAILLGQREGRFPYDYIPGPQFDYGYDPDDSFVYDYAIGSGFPYDYNDE